MATDNSEKGILDEHTGHCVGQESFDLGTSAINQIQMKLDFLSGLFQRIHANLSQ